MNNELLKNDMATPNSLSILMNPNDEFYCSIEDNGSRQSKIAIYNAINNVDDEVANHINETFEIVDVAAHHVTIIDETTGEEINAVRVILIDKNGVSYSATSQGIFNSLTKIFGIVGMPSWKDEPVKMKFKQVKTRNNNNKVNVIELVP